MIELAFLFLIQAIKFDTGVRVGSDYISQTYALLETDTLDITTESKAIFDFDLEYEPNDQTTLGCENKFFFTTLAYKDFFTALGNLKFASDFKLDLRNETEFKLYHDLWQAIDTSLRNNYLQNTSNILLTKKFGDLFVLKVRENLEVMRYEMPSSFSYNYYLNRLLLTGSKNFGTLSSIDLDYQFGKRIATNFSDNDYSSHRGGTYFDLFFNFNPHVNLENQIERRIYNSSSRTYWSDNYVMLFDYQINPTLTVELKNQGEYIKYDRTDEINYDYLINTPAIGLEIKLVKDLRVKLQPGVNVLDARSAAAGEDYRQGFFKFSLDLMKIKKLWLALDNTTGKRIYANTNSTDHSNYIYNETRVFFDYTILDNLSLDLIATYGPEWHDDPADDMAIGLFSFELKYGF